jgi:hypothetical protein
MGFEFRASHLFGKYSKTWAVPPTLFTCCCCYYYLFYLLFCPGLVSDCDPAAYTSHIVGITGMLHCAQTVGCDEGYFNFLPGLASNYYSPDLCFQSSWNEPPHPSAEELLLLFNYK